MDSDGSSMVILSVCMVGILGTALLLLSYYLFLTRCGLLFFFCRTTTRIVSVQDDDGQPPRRSSSGGGGGLDGAAIRRIPTLRYGRRSKCSSSEECAVCLADFRDGERLRLLPACLHAFHIDCIDAWLQSNANCPLCRAPVVAITSSDDDYQLLCIADATSSSGAEAAPAAATSGFLLGRRSLSMDSSSCAHKRFYLALILQQHNSNSISIGVEEDPGKVGEGGSSITSSRRLRRSFFSFSHNHSRGSSLLPL
nr:unnamed protein product [Digitaria exilis]